MRSVRHLAALLSAGVLIAYSSGCEGRSNERSQYGVPEGRFANAPGERVVVESTGERTEEAVAKLRGDDGRWKVYDAQFAPVGEVRLAPTTTRGVAGDASTNDGGTSRVEVLRYGAGGTEAIERVRRGVHELADRFRLERTSRGWAVFGGEANWLGRFERVGDGGWQLVAGPSAETIWSSRREGDRRIVDSEEGRGLRAPEGSVPPTVLLSLELESLSLVDRAAIGLWLAHRGDEP